MRDIAPTAVGSRRWEHLSSGVWWSVCILCPVLVADLRHFLDLPDDAPGPARRLAAQLGDLVRAATSADPGPGWISALPCRRRPGHRACPGRMTVARPDPAATIVFECTDCGDGGMISGCQHSPYDCTDGSHPRPAAEQLRELPVPAHVADSLRTLAFLDRNCERIVYGARLDRGVVVLAVTKEDLDELIGSVAAEANHEPDGRRRRRLDAAFDTLDTAARHVDQLSRLRPPARGVAAGGSKASRSRMAGPDRSCPG